MEQNELSIGNYVLMDRCIIEIVEIGLEHILIKTKQGTVLFSRYDLIDPIPLSSDWLKKLGAKKVIITGWVVSGATYWEINGIVFYENAGKFYIPIGVNQRSISLANKLIRFDKVHELQNIFSLTGEKLEIK